MIHISIKPERIFSLWAFPVTNSLLAAGVVLVLFTLCALWYNRISKRKSKNSFFYLITLGLRLLYSLFHSVFGEKTDYFFPLLASFFFFILLHNWFGLIPGVGSLLIAVKENSHVVFAPLLRGDTTDLNTTLALALISVSYTQVVGVTSLGLKEYLKKFINLKSPMAFFTGVMETISEFSKIIAFSFRLFGNIFAGEVIIAIMAFLIPILISFPFLLFEIFIGFIQAVVFALLSAVFFRLAMEKAH